MQAFYSLLTKGLIYYYLLSVGAGIYISVTPNRGSVHSWMNCDHICCTLYHDRKCSSAQYLITIKSFCIIQYVYKLYTLFISILELLRLWQVEKQRADLTRELDDLTDRLEEAGGVTASQVNYIQSTRHTHTLCTITFFKAALDLH